MYPFCGCIVGSCYVWQDSCGSIVQISYSSVRCPSVCEITVVPLSFMYRVKIEEKEEIQELLPVFVSMCVCIGAFAYVYYARIRVLLIQCRPWIARAYCAWPTDPNSGSLWRVVAAACAVLPSRLMCDVQQYVATTVRFTLSAGVYVR